MCVHCCCIVASNFNIYQLQEKPNCLFTLRLSEDDRHLDEVVELALCPPSEWQLLFFYLQFRHAFVSNTNYFVSPSYSDSRAEMEPYWA